MTVVDECKRVLRFCMVHMTIGLVHYVVVHIHFKMCYSLHPNPLLSFMYSYIYNSSEYCVTLSSIMSHTSHISRSMWHTIGAGICLETIGWVKFAKGRVPSGGGTQFQGKEFLEHDST